MIAAYAGALGLAAWLIVLSLWRRNGLTAIRRLHSQLSWAQWMSPRRVDQAALIALALVWLITSLNYPQTVDATVYWSLDLDALYERGIVNEVGAYLYSPAFAQALSPSTVLAWPVWYAMWAAMNLGLLVWMLGPAAALITLAFPPVSHAYWSGNIHFLLAATAILGVRHAGFWALPLLTKVTPGIGLLWHAGRKDLRAVITGMSWTIGLGSLSFLLAPHLWSEWLRVLSLSAQTAGPETLLPLSLEIRVAIAAAVVVFGGTRGWAWTIPVGMAIAQPIFWTAGLAVLVAAVPLSAWQSRDPAQCVLASSRRACEAPGSSRDFRTRTPRAG